MAIDKSNIKFPSEDLIETIRRNVDSVLSGSIQKLYNNPIFNFSKKAILTFMIGRFYYKSKYFENTSFFGMIPEENQFQKFKKNDFISLSHIPPNIKIVLYKKTNHLFVQKYLGNGSSYDSLLREKELYENINNFGSFVHYYGYVLDNDGSVESIIIEFMSNGTLFNLIPKIKEKAKNNNKYKKKRILIIISILTQLYELHSKNIIYRDLKPNNIFVDHNLNIAIGDFDSSRELTTTHELTQDIGTDLYKSPEMKNSENYTFSVDIYSFGLIIYFIYTNRSKVSDLKKGKLFEDQIEDDYIKDIYAKCLEKDPNERPTAEQILKDIIYELSMRDDEFSESILSELILDNNPIIQQIMSMKHEKYIIDESILNGNRLLESLGLPTVDVNQFYEEHYINDTHNEINPLIQKLIISADINNDIVAKKDLGLCFLYGINVGQNYIKGINYLTNAAELNNIEAQYIL